MSRPVCVQLNETPEDTTTVFQLVIQLLKEDKDGFCRPIFFCWTISSLGISHILWMLFGCCGWTVLVVHTVYLGGSFGGALCLGEAVNWVSRDSVRLLLITYWISFSFSSSTERLWLQLFLSPSWFWFCLPLGFVGGQSEILSQAWLGSVSCSVYL